ncbi:hypothetical protein P170DRAFT_141641 [Aspergillus steynii IBT 23096]|uniref:Uncharacterized protein n=1 Tax=Aspergillus steynii IBT 23096 TaxID=1392250 RepID=A0A2I2GBR5_9EURO|nr:uncharacterized protein P170DRAFT_141641 [Aspergillus steynii IBT 23096]PLB50316.1 hypothetical protein P170DRAFT_141641 [Aspergillus steynii IBT 23096]
MNAKNMDRQSWEPYSSTYSRLECSIHSQDSCYASDEVSMTSTKLPAPNSLASALKAPLRPILKSILKRPCAKSEDGSESGYGSHEMSDGECINASDITSESGDDLLEQSDDESVDASDDESDESDDEMYYVTAWEDDTDASDSDESDIMSEYGEEDGVDSLDGSFISFESPGVRFNSEIIYHEATYFSDADDEDEEPQTGMTCHEMMLLARECNTEDKDSDEAEISKCIKEMPEHYPSDLVDVDKCLFAAYMHGIQGIADPEYKARLRARTKEVRAGRTQSPYLDSKEPNYIYIDQALNHVLGSFSNLVTEEELDDLVTISDSKGLTQRLPGAAETLDRYLTGKIEDLLLERLATDDVIIGSDELSFFAGGIGFAIEHWRPYVCCH